MAAAASDRVTIPGAPQEVRKTGYQPVTVTKEQLHALEEKHEDVAMFKGGERAPWLVVVRRPTRKETVGYKAHARRDQTTANEELIKRITVYPTGDDAEKQLDRWPFFPDGLADSDAFKSFLGLAVEEQGK